MHRAHGSTHKRPPDSGANATPPGQLEQVQSVLAEAEGIAEIRRGVVHLHAGAASMVQMLLESKRSGLSPRRHRRNSRRLMCGQARTNSAPDGILRREQISQ
jgi:hypothetical protein